MMNRRNFIASTAVLGATSLVGTATAKESEGTADVNPDLTGVWVDPFLQQPSTIIIDSNQSGSNVQVMGIHWHKNQLQTSECRRFRQWRDQDGVDQGREDLSA